MVIRLVAGCESASSLECLSCGDGFAFLSVGLLSRCLGLVEGEGCLAWSGCVKYGSNGRHSPLSMQSRSQLIVTVGTPHRRADWCFSVLGWVVLHIKTELLGVKSSTKLAPATH